MVRGFVYLLVCQLLGETIARGFGLPVPGPVLGMAILLAGLWLAGRSGPPKVATREIEGVSDALLRNLGLLFVPAGVGVIQYGGLVATYGPSIGVALVVSTIAAMLATVMTFVLVKRWLGRTSEEPS